MNLGRHQLLEWLNSTMESEYTSIEMLSDAVAYSQIIDIIHPGSINIFKINLTTRYPDDCLRNAKILEDALKKLRIVQPASFEKIARSKFQDNIIFLQWLYGYANKNGFESLNSGSPYQKRLQILQKQGKQRQDINPHLIPNQAYLEYGEGQWDEQLEENANNHSQQEKEVESRIQQIDTFVKVLENDLKERMELNYRMMHLVDKSIEERNQVFNLLHQIGSAVEHHPTHPIASHLLHILHEPYDFNDS